MSSDSEITGKPAEIYQKYLVPALFGPWCEAFAEFIAPNPGDSALDVACGTGALAECLSKRVGSNGRVAGLDMDEGMIAVAQTSRLPIDWRQGDALAMPFEDDAFDVVASHQGLQFFPDRAAGLAEMRRVLRPGGQLALALWRESELNPGQHALGQALGKWVRPELAKLPPFTLHDKTEVAGLVSAAGFSDIVVQPVKRISLFPSVARFASLLSAGASASTRGALAQLAPQDKDGFERDVEEMLAPYVTDRGLEIPMEAHFVSGRAPEA